MNQELFGTGCLCLRPPSDEPLVFTCAHHQTSVVKRKRLNQPPFFGVNVASNDLNAFFGLNRIDKANTCPLPCFFHPYAVKEFVEVDVMGDGHFPNPSRRLRQEGIASQRHLVHNLRGGGGDGHGGPMSATDYEVQRRLN